VIDAGCTAGEGDRAQLKSLIAELEVIRADLIERERREASRVSALPESQRASARNLFHYLALRRHDIRPLQDQLARLGLSSLGRAESHVLATVDAVLEAMHKVAGGCWQPLASPTPTVGFDEGIERLDAHMPT
jgi:pyruvate kinase